jgi:hypothetical protein
LSAARGLSKSENADRLVLSVRTVESRALAHGVYARDAAQYDGPIRVFRRRYV